MDDIAFTSVLEADPRPTVVLDLKAATTDSSHLKPHFLNSSAKSSASTLEILVLDNTDGTAFRRWANGIAPKQTSRPYLGPLGTAWVAYEVQSRWRVLQDVTSFITSLPLDVVTPSEDYLHGTRGILGFDVGGSQSPRRAPPPTKLDLKSKFGITDVALENVPGLQKHLDDIAAIDWSRTSAGALEKWQPELVQLVHIMLLDPGPQCLHLGSEKTLLYNAAFAKVIGDEHPEILGQPTLTAWPDCAATYISMFTSMDTTGCSYVVDDYATSLVRDGAIEEVHFRWTAVPLQAPLNGYWCTSSDETVRKVNERRKNMFTEISNACRGIRTMPQFWTALLGAIGTNGKDFPFAFVYSRDPSQKDLYRLEGLLDCDKDKASDFLSPSVDLSHSSEVFAPAFQEAVTSPKPVWIRQTDGTLPDQIATLSQARGSGDKCTSGFVCAICRVSDQSVLGFLVLGTNTRKTFSKVDFGFVCYLTKTLGDLATNAVNAHESDRLAKLAASQEQSLVKALAESTSEVHNLSAKLQTAIKTLETIDIGFFAFTLEGALLQANEAFFNISGHPRGSPDPEVWRECIHPDDIEHCEKYWQLATTGESAHFQYRYPLRGQKGGKQGTVDGCIFVECHVVPMVDEHGKSSTISGYVTDITDQKRRQHDAQNRAETLEKLRESEQRFNLFTRNTMCPMYILNTERKLHFCNDAYRELVGENDIKNSEDDAFKIIHADDLDRMRDVWTEAMKNPRPLQLTFRLSKPWKGPDGAIVPTWVVGSTTPAFNDQGVLTSWVGVLLDVSYFKWAERMQELRKEEAIEAKRQHEEFIDMTSHEIRNPLGAVVHCADSIAMSLTQLEKLSSSPDLTITQREQMGDIHGACADAVNTIIACSTHQQRMLEDVLVYSKLNSNLLKITPTACRPAAILHDIRNMFEMDAQKAGIAFDVVYDQACVHTMTAEWLMLDVGRLMQVLINLITNAIKFTRSETTRQVTVTMRITTGMPSSEDMSVAYIPRRCTAPPLGTEFGTGAAAYLSFLVSDTGCGLSAAGQSRIFSRFSQGSHRTHSKYGGSGLGLYISRELVELQSGAIGFRSAPGQGSTFGFYVAARTAQPVPACPRTEKMVLREGPRRPSHRAFSILIVEDNVINQAVLRKQLTRLGHEVHIASDGAEALRFLEGTTHWLAATNARIALDIVLMDVEMPIMDGLRCVERIREMQAQNLLGPELPVIAVSANARAEQVQDALAAGMDDAISKPFRIVDLMPKIERLVRE